ncbi:MAG: MFS transporter [Clostridiales bacterium]|nr:MFS transporter [Clostridiales bacterium]
MTDKRRMALFMLVNVMFNIGANCHHPNTPTLFKNLGLPDYMFGYALAAMLVMNFLFSPFWGKLNTYISSKFCMLVACGGYGLGQLFFGLARTSGQFLFARAFAGVFSSGAFVSIINYVVNTSEDGERGTNLTVTATIQSVAGAFGYFVGGMLGEISAFFAIAFQSVLLACCGVFFLLVCKNDAKISLKEVKTRQLVREANPFAAFMASGEFMTFALAIFFTVCTLHAMGQTAFDQSFNYYLKDQFNFSSGYNGVLKALMGLITLLANSTLCMYLIRRTDVNRSVIGVLSVCAVTMLAVIFQQSMIPFVVLNVIFYALAASVVPLIQSIAADSAKGKDSNLVMGFFNAMKSLGGILGAMVAGSFYAMNPIYPFVFSFAAMLLATFCAASYYRKTRKAPAPEPAGVQGG